ncbi:response regulator [Aestuariibacter sp. AA17]|uniref:Response regulator n=1 Tax=Fluctibacter corallii TaxID=2984329 RepID=A0ABT3A978_9ALTE|nr:response regulator [Aestuariibacter sp. AA17]MCV2885233.1 response regulator [Aestuariibacter sp. AA17]
MEKRIVSIAVVEDNGMAQINIRNHLLAMEFNKVDCFSHGRELKSSMRRRHYDILLMDFHLGENKNGVEVVQDLKREGLLKETTSLVFITSDRMPMIIGQIVDIHPDDLVLKPYTINNLQRTVVNTLKVNLHLKSVHTLMDAKKYAEALEKLEELMFANKMPRAYNHMLKLKARLLIKLERFDEATLLYKNVLQSSDKIIWAKWGLIQSEFLAGRSELSEKILKGMLGTHLTNDKACEWLARISIDKKEFVKAEEYMEQIKESSLSVPATKLKAYLYQIQDKVEDAVGLLERRREASRSVKEKFAEYSLELARCYLKEAEDKPANERADSLQVARFLIGSAGRRTLEDGLDLKRSYMNVVAAILEGNMEKAENLLKQEGIDNFKKADVSTMTDAVKAWLAVGDELKASQILCESENKMLALEDFTEKTLSNMLISKSEENLGEKRPRALKFNKQGLELYNDHKVNESIDYFYQAYILFPEEPAFGLNLLQSLVEGKIPKHKEARTLRLFNDLSKRELSTGNKKRIEELGDKIEQHRDMFIVVEPAPKNGLLNQ